MGKRPTNRYIAIVGVMGSGKTTAGKILKKELGLPLLEERPQDNPFLELLYQDMKRWGLHCQLSFTLQRIRQNIEAKKMLAYTSVIHDVPLEQNMIYTRTQHKLGNITTSEYNLITNIVKLYSPQMISPDLLIVLEASMDLLQKRIAKRGRDYEQNVPKNYIATLRRIQNNWTSKYPKDKKILIPMDKIDLKRKADREMFVETIKAFLKK